MTKAELVKSIADSHTVLSIKEAGQILDFITDTIIATTAKGEEVALAGFGKFSCVDRAAREGRNPQTGKAIKIPAKKAPKFSPGKEFRDAVNAPKKAAKK